MIVVIANNEVGKFVSDRPFQPTLKGRLSNKIRFLRKRIHKDRRALIMLSIFLTFVLFPCCFVLFCMEVTVSAHKSFSALNGQFNEMSAIFVSVSVSVSLIETRQESLSGMLPSGWVSWMVVVAIDPSPVKVSS